MLDLLPPVYLVALGLGLAAVFVVLFYSFTSNSNYESQMRRKQLAERRAKQAASETQSSDRRLNVSFGCCRDRHGWHLNKN